MKRRLDGIESLRAYAAISVVFFHVVHAGHAALPEQLKFIATHFGMGVPLFFVVSGFSLAYGYTGKLDDARDLKNYFVRRFMRIAPLFYPALIFQLVLLWLAYGVTFPKADVILNFLFLFNFVPSLTDGILPASWTIGVEMLFYAIFPLLLLVCTSWWKSLIVLGIALLLAARFGIDTKNIVEITPSFVYHNFVKNLPLFLCGITAYHVFRRIEPPHGPRASQWAAWALLGLATIVIYVLYTSIDFTMFFVSRDLRTLLELCWGLPFALICIGMAIHPPRVFSNRVTRYLGLISFSIYLIHPNIIYGLGQAGLYKRVEEAIPGHEILAFAVNSAIGIAIVVAIATVTFRVFERPGMAWGKRLAPSPVAEGSGEISGQKPH